MEKNVGGLDRIARVAVGLGLLTYAIASNYAPLAAYLPGWPSTAGWAWLGWLGVIPLATGLASNCPAYSVLGVSTKGKTTAS